MIVFSSQSIVNAQNSNLLKQISDSLPVVWFASIDTPQNNEIIIRSVMMKLEPDMTSNDPPEIKMPCEIYILILPKISRDSLKTIKKRNSELRNQLPAQNSKDNLKDWYLQNEKTLTFLDAEPTHFDDKNSYRIKCSRLPFRDKDKLVYSQIMAYLNRLFQKY